MNRFCNTCDIEIDENKYMKERTVCKSCYNKNRRKNNKQNHQPKIEHVNNNNDNNISVPTYENHRYVIIGPSNVGETFYMLKVLEKIGNRRPIHIITRSLNQYPNYKTNTEIKPINKYKGSDVKFDHMLGAKKVLK